ncbi:peptidoglycan D,D-transpeptidase FtsI family protein [Compostimonas suwonensis]|uniref:Cell division protein FtsI (Penicillin-binding protein 3) n=1 Tax=Compostimonas suwonensis TaxID=1048394 RepID=A0A2M9BAX8_9MICO|nr:penicillin-binding protein 2 [Compostimonas suwonensis]PJJ55098.1 cell division protein FtsI (penicillin-binding protein 3) [Compostimonas suwonensis]
MTANSRSHRRRLAIAIVGLLAIVGVFVVKLVDIQVVRADEINTESLGKRSVPVDVYGTRGSILDDKGVVLADSVDRFDITISPEDAKPFEREGADGKEVTVSVAEAAAEIGAITGQTPESILAVISGALAADPDSQWAMLTKTVDLDVYRAVAALEIPWTYFARVPGRVYPNGSVAGNLVGFVGSDGTPLAGIEEDQDSCLASVDGEETYEKGADGVRLPGSTVTTKQAKDGGDVVLTIDSDLQWFSQQRLAEQVQAVGGTYGIATVMEVKTGKLLAVAEYPTVDPNNVDATAEADRGSRAFSAPFEPGSTGKSLTAASLIDAGVADPLTQVVAPYRQIFPNGADINDSDYHDPENLTLTGVLMESSNTGMSLLGDKLDEQTRYDYLKKFGVGTETEVGFPGESGGILNDLPWDNQSHYATTFGQAYSTTAIQVASIYQTLGNKGVRMPVQLVEGCRQPDGTITDAPAAQGTQVVSESAATQTVNALESVVTDGWLSDTLTIPGYRVAAKTGTAQMSDGNGAYSHSYLVSLAGIAPADDPQYVVSVNIANPVTITSSAASAPVFQEIMTQVLKTYRVKPSTEPSPNLPTTW